MTGRSRRRCRAAAVVVAVVALGAAVGAAFATRSQAPPAARRPLAGVLTGRAPWPANTRFLRARLAAVGLPALTAEGTAYHIHSHLDVFIDGKHVVVPAGIGIDPGGAFISPIHTHDTTGVIHVESPTVRTFTLGEFFDVWGVRFGRRTIGGYETGGGRVLRVYLNGRRVANAARLPLAEHEEIVVAYGTPQQLLRPVPSGFAFAPGL